jgi:hypothetical protein
MSFNFYNGFGLIDNRESAMPDRTLPTETPSGFVRSTGIPNTASSKPYFAAVSEAVARCVADPKCVGVSGQRLFYGTPGFPTTVPGRAGEKSCFIRS